MHTQQRNVLTSALVIRTSTMGKVERKDGDTMLTPVLSKIYTRMDHPSRTNVICVHLNNTLSETRAAKMLIRRESQIDPGALSLHPRISRP